MADWSSLPFDLLSLITTHLLDLSDLIRFSSVCSQWRSITPKHRHHHQSLPWLLLCPHETLTDGNLRFFSLSDHRTYSFSLPKTLNNHLIFTSALGWLVAVSYQSEKEQSFFSLVNPITRQTIFLPPLSHCALKATIKLLKLRASNDDGHHLVLVVRISKLLYSFLCHADAGDSTWKNIHPPNHDCFYTDFAVHNRNLFASDSKTLETHVFDLDTCVYVAKIPEISKVMPDIHFGNKNICKFVESPYGELFCVVIQILSHVNMFTLSVLRLEESEEGKWVKVENSGFGGYSVFVNQYNTMCFELRGFDEWKENRVYIVGPIKFKPSCEREDPDPDAEVWFVDAMEKIYIKVRLSSDRQLKDSFLPKLFVPSL